MSSAIELSLLTEQRQNSEFDGRREPLSRNSIQKIRVIDSHTAGEPTRLVIAGGPDLGAGSLANRLSNFRSHQDWFRSAVVNEPRGSDVMVGALLCEPLDPSCAAGVIFFNNVGYLGMCGHGTIGLISSLAHLGRIAAFNGRRENPTAWQLEVHTGPDPLERLLRERPGNVVVISGRNVSLETLRKILDS